MKLNPDCMRDILLQIEELPYGESVYPDQLYTALPDYSHDEIDYSILKMNEAGFINATIERYLSGNIGIEIYDISYDGHQFLDTVRSNKVWKATKKVATDIGSTSVHAITQIATSVITEIIKQTVFPVI